MRYRALICDYDGTLAKDGSVAEPTIAALERVVASGRKLLMVTGRRLEELQQVFPRADLFEKIVAENGAVIYDPRTRRNEALAAPPPAGFVNELRSRGVEPVEVGKVIVATWKPHEAMVRQTIRDLGLDLSVVLNKAAVMVLPQSINKSSGMLAALKELQVSPREAVGVGDAENDLSFLNECQCSVAVANALDAVKEAADLVTAGDHGRGVEELIQRLLDSDLKELDLPLRA